MTKAVIEPAVSAGKFKKSLDQMRDVARESPAFAPQSLDYGVAGPAFVRRPSDYGVAGRE